MNDRPEQGDWPEPVQDMMSDEDFAMIVQEMVRTPGYEEGRAGGRKSHCLMRSSWRRRRRGGLMVVTRNKKDFKGANIRVPYELETVTSTRVINVRPLPLP